MAVDAAGSLFLSDYDNHVVRKVDPSGIISTLAGTGVAGFGGDGGPATSAVLQQPYGVAVDGTGNVYVAELGNHRVRKIDTRGIITTIAGDGVRGFRGDGGPAVNASVGDPTGLAFDANGNLFVTTGGLGRIRRITPAGVITTVGGSGAPGFSGDGGPATAAALQ
jgi:serine/threonine-protein kinase